MMSGVLRRVVAVLGTVLAVAAAAAPTGAATVPAGRPLDWGACADAPGWECATASVPKIYGRPDQGQFKLAVTRLPATNQAHKVGSLFINYGGPGASAADITQAVGGVLFGALHDRFDIVAFDPRGTGQTSQAIDCQVDQEAEGLYGNPFFEPGDDVGAYLDRINGYWAKCQARNKSVLPYTSTANYARDMNLLRRSVGDDELTYFGFSYGTFIGATYAALFPHRIRAIVMDGALDPDVYINRPMTSLRVQTAAFEYALNRFFEACNQAPGTCEFGGPDPHLAFDRLVARADASPIKAGGVHPQPVTGDDILTAAFSELYSKYGWTELAQAINEAVAGDGTLVRQLSDAYNGRNDDGTYSPFNDRYLALSAEQRYPNDLRTYLDAGEESWLAFPHFWWNAGYVELYWRAIPAEAQGAFYGPFTVPGSATGTPLVIGTRYDPATPYREARNAVRKMGNARLLTMNGDGHTAFFNGSDCIDSAVIAYLRDLTLPPEGTQCDQDVPFPLPATVGVQAKGGLEHGFAGRGQAPIRPGR